MERVEADLPPGLMTVPPAALPGLEQWVASTPNGSGRVTGSPSSAAAEEIRHEQSILRLSGSDDGGYVGAGPLMLFTSTDSPKPRLRQKAACKRIHSSGSSPQAAIRSKQ
jgi:hypothetical protein